MAGTNSAFSKPAFLRTIVLTLAAIVILFFIDTFLASKERSESLVEGARLYRAGQALMQKGEPAAAADQFRAALSVDRRNQEFQLALSRALSSADRFSDAETMLADLLERDGTGGPANLAMARVLAKEGRTTESVSYYHRAIYGQWAQNSLSNRVQARFELVDLLISRNQTQGLLAELLPLEEEAPDDLPTRMKLGRLFLAAGSPARAADLYRQVLKTEPESADAYAGLGQSELARGNYRTAAQHFQTVLRLRPNDADAQRQLQLCSQVLTLDPTQRGLGIEERFERSTKVLDLLVDEIQTCPAAAAAGTLHDNLDAAQKALKLNVRPAAQSAIFESNLDLADKLWQARKAQCNPPATSNQDPLALVLNRLAQ